jgi:hypothetical protein
MNVFYSVLFDGDRVHSSWWTESSGSLLQEPHH